MVRSLVETEGEKSTELAEQIDKLVYDEAPSVFLCRPMTLVAVTGTSSSRATPPRKS
jgi:ABC-type transport system substrate-binding protein